ncbi:type II toxin-antitoxin system death-on-curing family toxin [Rhodobacteraceae bacterium M385]|nr:type II toxin-antitoxin system death-on-curing family toxin [Rhodobacteraceae bacterium M385]
MSVADAFAAHFDALEAGGGRRGDVNLALLESALGRPYSGYHKPIARKSAALLHAVVKNHAFVDGNKRTAFLLMDLLITRSGYQLKLFEDDRIDDMVVDVASDSMDFESLVEWLRLRLVRC